MTNKDKIKRALALAHYGTTDGEHHKMWVIDQMVRALTGCPMVEVNAEDYKGCEYKCVEQGESKKYKHWVESVCEGEHGANTYSWDIGIPP